MGMQSFLAAAAMAAVFEGPFAADRVDSAARANVPKALPSGLIGGIETEFAIPRSPASTTREEHDRQSPTLRQRFQNAWGKVLNPVARLIRGDAPAVGDRTRLVAEAEELKLKRFSPEIESIQYLARLDPSSYPEVIDSLIASLDDKSPAVRHAALEALMRKAAERGSLCRSAEGRAACDSVDCPACRISRKIVTRLEAMLLEVDDRGALKERFLANREIALAIILAVDSGELSAPAAQFASESRVEPSAGKSARQPLLEPIPDFDPPTDAPAQTPRTRSKLFRWFEGASSKNPQEPAKARESN